MDIDKITTNKHDTDKKSKNYSQVKSFDRLSNEDFEIASAITAGGDESMISKNIND